MPERFDLRYVDARGERRRPVMLHRAMLGSLERFLGILLEHHGAALPAWLAPEQVAVALPVSGAERAAADALVARLGRAGLRARRGRGRTRSRSGSPRARRGGAVQAVLGRARGGGRGGHAAFAGRAGHAAPRGGGR